MLARDAIMEGLPVGFVRVTADGSIAHANGVALDFLGLSYDEATGRYTADFNAIDETGDSVNWEDFLVTKTLRTGERTGPTVYGIERPDGKRRWGVFNATPMVNDDDVVTEAVVSILDITVRRRAEEKLRQSEARLWSVLESTPSMIMFVDRELKLQFLNRYAPGHTPASVRGRHIREFLPPGDQDRVVAVLEGVLATGEPDQYEVPPYAGVYDRWYAADVGPVKRNGEIVGVVVNVSDVTDRVELQSRLLVADRLASQGMLAASVVHEINNPLTYVMANLQRLQRGNGTDDASRAKMMADALEGAERIRNVVRDLSSLSRSPERESSRSDVRLVLESSVRMARSELQHRARLELDLGDVPAVRCEASRLGQVFLNLLVNAAQAIPVGDAEFNEVRVTTRTGDDGWAVIEVSDTGEGISKELSERIFEPFVSLKDEGSGLGLYISASIIRAAGGRLSVEPTPDGGSCFRVELPPATSDSAGVSRNELYQTPGANARILVIDDEEGVLGFMQDALAEHDVTVVGDGLRALELIGASDFDVIFCDLIMPDVSGMEVFECIINERPELVNRVVFMTGGAFTPKAREFLAKSERPLLEKPFAISEVLEFISEAIESKD